MQHSARHPWERVTKFTYSYDKRAWSQSTMTVVVDSRPFGEGSLRKAHHMYDIEGNRWVAKAHRTPVSETMIFTEVAMQGLCQHLAKCYNRQGAPKPVNFLEAFIIRTHSGVYMQCEEWMPGYFNKHNNNAGWCEGDLTRNTPQALSHFTYAFSKGRCMVVAWGSPPPPRSSRGRRCPSVLPAPRRARGRHEHRYHLHNP